MSMHKHRKQLHTEPPAPQAAAPETAAEPETLPVQTPSVQDAITAALTRILRAQQDEAVQAQPRPFDGRIDDAPAAQRARRQTNAGELTLDDALESLRAGQPVQTAPAVSAQKKTPDASSVPAAQQPLAILDDARWERPAPQCVQEPSVPAPSEPPAPEPPPKPHHAPDWAQMTADSPFRVEPSALSHADMRAAGQAKDYSASSEAVSERLRQSVGIVPQSAAPIAEYSIAAVLPEKTPEPEPQALPLQALRTAQQMMQGVPVAPPADPGESAAPLAPEHKPEEAPAAALQLSENEPEEAPAAALHLSENEPEEAPAAALQLPDNKPTEIPAAAPRTPDNKPDATLFEAAQEPDFWAMLDALKPALAAPDAAAGARTSTGSTPVKTEPRPAHGRSYNEKTRAPQPAAQAPTGAATADNPASAVASAPRPHDAAPETVRQYPPHSRAARTTAVPGARGVPDETVRFTPIRDADIPAAAPRTIAPAVPATLPHKQISQASAARGVPDETVRFTPIRDAGIPAAAPRTITAAAPATVPHKQITQAPAARGVPDETVRFTPIRDADIPAAAPRTITPAAPKPADGRAHTAAAAQTDAQSDDFWTMLDELKSVIGTPAAPQRKPDAPYTAAEPAKQPRQPAVQTPKPAAAADNTVVPVAPSSEKPVAPSADPVADAPAADETVRFTPLRAAAPLAAVQTATGKPFLPPVYAVPPMPHADLAPIPGHIPADTAPIRKRPQKPEASAAGPADAASPQGRREKATDADTPARSKHKKMPAAPAYASAQDAHHAYSKLLGTAGVRLVILGFLCIVSIFLTVYLDSGWQFLPQLFSARLLSYLLPGLLLAGAALCFDVLADGLLGLLRLRLNLNSLLLLVTLTACVDSVYAVMQARTPLCAAVLVMLLFSLWGKYDRCTAMLTTLKALSTLKTPVGIFEVQDILKGSRGLARDEGSAGDFLAHFSLDNPADSVMRVYAPIALALSVTASALICAKTGAFLPWTLTLLLLGSLPLGGFLGYARLFAVLAKRLAASGATLCGWYGARVLGGEHTILLGDDDLFPRKNISFNGIKVYSGNMDRLIAYAAAATTAADASLASLFDEQLQSRGARRCTAERYRYYESGGIGAEISRDIVLLGTLDFMRHMGVHMDADTRVRQALYLSVNGELAAVFAIKYQMSESVQRGLSVLTRNRCFKPVLATRDFLITPEFLKKYQLPTGNILYPGVKERLRLSETALKTSGAQSALLERDSFGAFAEAVAGGRALRAGTVLSSVVSVLGGTVGMALMALLAFFGAVSAATPTNLLLYLLGWAIPTLLVTGWTRRG